MDRLAIAGLAVQAGCAAPLIPGELVLGEDIPAWSVAGDAGSSLGWSVAVGELDGDVGVIAGAPGVGAVRAWGADGATLWEVDGVAGLGWRVGVVDGEAWAWAPGQGVFAVGPDGLRRLARGPASGAVTVCPGGEVLTVDRAGEDVDCGEGGAVRTQCGEDCAVEVRVAGGALWSPVGRTSPGAAVSWWEGRACWGDPDRAAHDAPGRVLCAGDDAGVEGLAGDHLGGSLGGGRAAGVMNRRTPPGRARVVPLAEGAGDVWAVDRAAPGSRLAVAGDGVLFAVGVPGFGEHQAREGRVFIVEVR